MGKEVAVEMECIICKETLDEKDKAVLTCQCTNTSMGLLHKTCAETWKTVSGSACMLRCNAPKQCISRAVFTVADALGAYMLGTSLVLLLGKPDSLLHTASAFVQVCVTAAMWTFVTDAT